MERISIDDSTKVITFKNNGERVTGKVVYLMTIDSLTGKKVKSELEVKNGLITELKTYYPNGDLLMEGTGKNGKLNGISKEFYEGGNIRAATEYKDGYISGRRIEYRQNGKIYKEMFFENDSLIKEYAYSEDGKKIIPITEKIELVKMETGFYKNVDVLSLQVLYQPIVLMSWKNISGEPITETIEMEGVFLKEDEEWSKDSDYFQGYSDSPLQPSITRQANLKSHVGYTSSYGVSKTTIYCQIFINKEPFKKVKINNKVLYTNRLQ